VQRVLLYFLLSATFAISTANVIFLNVVHYASGHFNPTLTTSIVLGGPGDETVYDLETWTCEVDRFQQSMGYDDWPFLGTQCHLEKGARCLSLILFIQSGILLMLFLVDWRRNQSVLCQKKWRYSGERLDMTGS
jgi:hypothetical protein